MSSAGPRSSSAGPAFWFCAGGRAGSSFSGPASWRAVSSSSLQVDERFSGERAWPFGVMPSSEGASLSAGQPVSVRGGTFDVPSSEPLSSACASPFGAPLSSGGASPSAAQPVSERALRCASLPCALRGASAPPFSVRRVSSPAFSGSFSFLPCSYPTSVFLLIW